MFWTLGRRVDLLPSRDDDDDDEVGGVVVVPTVSTIGGLQVIGVTVLAKIRRGRIPHFCGVRRLTSNLHLRGLTTSDPVH